MPPMIAVNSARRNAGDATRRCRPDHIANSDSDCDIVPQRAVEAVGPTDALVLVYLYQGMASRSAKLQRPFVFGPDLPWQTGPVQCTDGNADVTVSTLSFEDGKVRISVMVVVGKNASPQREAEIYAVLDSLRSL